MIKQKKAAIELSIGTVVVIVLAMSMLILGLVLVRSIFTGATESVDTLNDRVKGQITSIFADEGSKIAISLSADKIAKIEQGTDGFGVGIGAQTRDGESVLEGTGGNIINLEYDLTLTNDACDFDDDFIEDHRFIGGKTERKRFQDEEGPNGFTVLVFDIPEGTPECSQAIRITTYDREKRVIATSVFRIQVVSGGIFS